MAISKVIFNNEVQMDVTDTTATPEDVEGGKYFTQANGVRTAGTDTDRVKGSGTSGYLMKWAGATSATNGPQLGNSTTTFLRNDGQWSAPVGTTYASATTAAAGLMSADDKKKINSIATSAEVNQNAFSYIVVGNSTVSADSKTDTLTLAAGNNVTLTPTTNTDTITIAATNSTYANATTATAGLMSTDDKKKLNSIATSAQVNPTFTSFTGKPTSNSSPAFGGSVTISQISQNTSGQISGTDRTITIPSATATTAANGLMSSSDKQKLNSIATSATDNKGTVGGSGTDGYIAKWNSTTSITNGPQFGTATNTFLRNDGEWATPPSQSGGTTNNNIIDGTGSSAIHQIRTLASGENAFSGGYMTSATGKYSHAEGYQALASTNGAHAEGYSTSSAGMYSHAEGEKTTASGRASHSQGYYTIANQNYQTIVGKYNSTANTNAAFVVGNGTGTATSSRKNAFSVDWSGNTTAAGKITAGAIAVNANDVPTLAQTTALIPTIPTNVSAFTNDAGYLTSYTETDPTVPSWAKASSKPSYTASEVGAASSSHTHGNITNAGDITTTATIASGDRLVINDQSASKITNSSITFGTATNTFLRNDGSWAAPVGTTYSNATTATAGLLSTTDKKKLDSIASSAQVNPTFTAFTGKPTGNLTPFFGDSVTISQISQSTNGQVSGTDRTLTIPNAVATIATAGLMSSSDKQKLDSIASSATIGTINNNIIDGSGSSALHQINSYANGNYAFAEGYQTSASSYSGHSQGFQSRSYNSTANHAEGYQTTASGSYGNHSQGRTTLASGTNGSHAQGLNTIASGAASHAQGSNSQASGSSSHAEGSNTFTSGSYSHSQGYHTTASGDYGSHAEGQYSQASGRQAHAEGRYSFASSTASHSQGYYTTASGIASHSGGYYTIAYQDYQTVIGKYNSTASTDTAFIIGNGTGDNSASRKNALYVNWDGGMFLSLSNNADEGTDDYELYTKLVALSITSEVIV